MGHLRSNTLVDAIPAPVGAAPVTKRGCPVPLGAACYGYDLRVLQTIDKPHVEQGTYVYSESI